MKRIYIIDELSTDHVVKVQDEALELGWVGEKTTIPAISYAARRQWVMNAEEWLREHCEEGWLGMAYIADGTLYSRFEHASDAAAFKVARAHF